MSTNSKSVTKAIEVAGRTMTFKVGGLAARASAEILATYGETTVLATLVIGKEDPKKDYFPLSIEFQERLYAGGRIKGSRWVKREGRPTEAEVLAGRLTDRSIRPLFPKWFKNEVQIVLTVLSVDGENDADILALNAASALVAISAVPWNGPVAATRIGLLENDLVVNPKNGKNSAALLDLTVASSETLIPMIEAGAKQIPEDKMFEAITLGFESNKAIIKMIKDLVLEVGKEKINIAQKDKNPELMQKVHASAKEMIAETVNAARGKPILERERAYDASKDAIAMTFDPKDQAEAKAIIDDLFTKEFRHQILDKKVRSDGRTPDELRDLSSMVGVIPRVHGSALFQRGDTQALTITTLGDPSLYQSLESAEGEDTKRYMHHYNFPPYSTGEAGRMGTPGRREIGHGALAERAISPVIPSELDFPYAIRAVSEILSSNGSTSMASTCGSCLSLMDAGVPILAPVSGISTGLITSDNYPSDSSNYVLLTDITGGEDHYGDMDFKVAGTETGITAIQLDVKVPGITLDICKQTFARAKIARAQILKVMLEAIPTFRPQLSKYAPQIKTTTIPVDKIGELIGPGGKNIKKLMADTGTSVDVRDDGMVFISGTTPEGVAQALNFVAGLSRDAVPGEIYEGTVVRLQPFGAFVNILPGKDGLVHVSRMGQGFVSDASEVVQEGQVVKVWVTEIDDQGRINLSMLFDEAGNPMQKTEAPRAPREQQSGGGMGHFSAPRQRRPQNDRRF